MSVRQILINQAGPLPHSATIQTGSCGYSTLFVSGSVWTEKQDTMIGIAVSMDGVKVGEAFIYSNGPVEHRAVVPVFINIEMDKEWPSETEPPSYTFELSALNGNTVSDRNDWFQLSFVA